MIVGRALGQCLSSRHAFSGLCATKAKKEIVRLPVVEPRTLTRLSPAYRLSPIVSTRQQKLGRDRMHCRLSSTPVGQRKRLPFARARGSSLGNYEERMASHRQRSERYRARGSQPRSNKVSATRGPQDGDHNSRILPFLHSYSQSELLHSNQDTALPHKWPTENRSQQRRERNRHGSQNGGSPLSRKWRGEWRGRMLQKLQCATPSGRSPMHLRRQRWRWMAIGRASSEERDS